jgi:hypothetical protein
MGRGGRVESEGFGALGVGRDGECRECKVRRWGTLVLEVGGGRLSVVVLAVSGLVLALALEGFR